MTEAERRENAKWGKRIRTTMTVQSWIEVEYDDLKYRGTPETIACTLNKCEGVVEFACSALFDEYNENLMAWWKNEMLPKFRELQRYQYELKHAPSYVNTTGVGAT